MIYPIPQKYCLNGKKLNISSVTVSGEFEAVAQKVFGEYNIPIHNGFKVVFKYENSKSTTYADDICRLTDEKYIINICKYSRLRRQ